MSRTVRLRNINPIGRVDLPIALREGDPEGEHGSGCLEPGEVFEVSAEVAGRAPTIPDWQPAVECETYPQGAEFRSAGVGTDARELLEVRDLGEGLLAQVGNYEPAKAPRARKAGTE